MVRFNNQVVLLFPSVLPLQVRVDIFKTPHLSFRHAEDKVKYVGQTDETEYPECEMVADENGERGEQFEQSKVGSK